jgi:ketosteroid isomerase-like protein
MASKLEQFLEAINDAFARGDVDFFETNVTDDVRWELVGDEVTEGREALLAMMRSNEGGPLPELVVENVITHGNRAAVEGTMRLADKDGAVKSYGFCDVYEMSGFTNPKIRSVKSYILETEKAA